MGFDFHRAAPPGPRKVARRAARTYPPSWVRPPVPAKSVVSREFDASLSLCLSPFVSNLRCCLRRLHQPSERLSVAILFLSARCGIVGMLMRPRLRLQPLRESYENSLTICRFCPPPSDANDLAISDIMVQRKYHSRIKSCHFAIQPDHPTHRTHK